MRRFALLTAVLLLALSGCGGDGEASTEARPSASATTAAAEPPFEELCSEWCADLEAAMAVCEFPGADLTVCRQDLARGLDATNAVSDAMARFDREPMSGVDNVLDAVDRVRESYDTFEDDSNCFSLQLTSLSSMPMSAIQEAEWTTCQLEANTAALSLSSVAGVLENTEQ